MWSDVLSVYAVMAASFIGMVFMFSWGFDYWDWWYAICALLPF